jgi:hypothetical protein
MELLGGLSLIVATGSAVSVAILKSGFQRYVDEKSRNLATIQDTARISAQVQAVESRFARRTHAWKEIFQQEYSILKEVWLTTWDFQATARALRPIIDYLPMDTDQIREALSARGSTHNASVKAFIDAVVKNKPFIAQSIYDRCLSLREAVVDLQIEYQERIKRPSAELDWELIRTSGKRLDQDLEALSDEIRNYVHGQAAYWD